MPADPTWFEHLGRLLAQERAAERARLEEDRAQLPLGELEARGLVLLDVEVAELAVGLGGRTLATFRRADGRPLATRLGPGDLVTLSPRRAEIDDPPAGTVAASRRHQVQVAFERPLPPWAEEGRLRLDISWSDVTFDRARSALATIQGWEQGLLRDRRQLLLGLQAPRFEKRRELAPTRPLNPEQAAAVALALSARDLALVHGPPGTGKSTVLAEVAVQLVGQGQRLFCSAASNAAVDHLLELCLDGGLRAVRVGHPARVLPHLQAHTLDLLVEAHPDRVLARSLFEEAFELKGYALKQRTQGRSRARFANAREASAEAGKLMDEARVLERRAVASVLDGAQVVCATLPGLLGSVLASRQADTVLLDEATQALEPLALIAFLKAPRVILAGDPRQLGPTVLSEAAARGGLGRSLFERLLDAYGEDVKQLLREQHRMHEGLMRFPSRELYGDQLRAHPRAAGRTLAEVLRAGAEVDAPPLLFLDTAGKGFEESKAPGTESLRNEGEAALVAARARELLAAGLDPRELAVITPYRAQAGLLGELLQDVEGLEVDTVDAFQGREKEAVLLSLVRSNAEGGLGFLLDLRRMNVAITRARRHLFAVGDSGTLGGQPFYRRFLEEAQGQGGYRSAWEWPDPAGPAS